MRSLGMCQTVCLSLQPLIDLQEADAAEDSHNAGYTEGQTNVTKADGRDRLKAKPQAIAKREGRGFGQPNGRRA